MTDSFGFCFAIRVTSSSIRFTSSDDWVETSSSFGFARWSALSHHDDTGTNSAITAATATKQSADERISTLLPAEKATAESEREQAQVELKKTIVRAGVSGRVEQFLLRVGDVVRIVAGDQILADATIRDGGSIEVDESLLTGESAAVAKGTGDELLAGSFCVSGTTLACVVRVG